MAGWRTIGEEGARSARPVLSAVATDKANTTLTSPRPLPFGVSSLIRSFLSSTEFWLSSERLSSSKDCARGKIHLNIHPGTLAPKFASLIYHFSGPYYRGDSARK